MKEKTLKLIPPTDIRKNDENPRIHFPEWKMESLAASIDEEGVLVPVSVFKDPDNETPPYVLIDGERRWQCSLKLGLSKIPAIVEAPPDPTKNLLKMFHIHMVRDQWDDMPTAWALQKLIERTGEQNTERLVEMTGLSKARLKALLFATTLPSEYQQLIDSGEVPLNYFYELRLHVIDPLKRERPAIFQKFGEKRILKSFVKKRLANVTTDVIELRRMRPIIKVAAVEAGGPKGTSDLDAVIEELISVRDRTIQEAYENTVEMVVEADKFSHQCQQLIDRFDRLMRKATSEEDRQLVLEAIRRLQSQLNERLEHFEA